MARKTSGEITEQEANELEQWLSEHPEYHLMLEMLEGIRSEFNLPVSPLMKEEFICDGWEKLEGRIFREDSERPAPDRGERELPPQMDTVYPWAGERRIPAFGRWAAVILVLITLGGGLFWLARQPTARPAQKTAAVNEDNNNTITTKRGSNTHIELPDGSSVTLYGGSELTYADRFSEGNRGVWLEGAAFFRIKKDADHPFVIQTEQIIIRVLGTEFNVRAYRREKRTVTTLVNGLIEVELKQDRSRHIYLHPNERLTVTEKGIQTLEGRKSAIRYAVTAVAPDSVSGRPESLPLLEKTGTKLVFRNEPFGDLAKLMEKRYGVKMIFENPGLKKEILAGAFDRENLTQALSALQVTTPFRYSIRGDTVWLRR